MSAVLYIAAPLAFHAEMPDNPGLYFVSLAVYIAVSLSVSSLIGLAVRDQAKTSVVSIVIFLPSIMLSGIMFPVELLPSAFETVGKLFPASWGFRLMADSTLQLGHLLPLIVILALAVCVCGVLLSRVDR